MPLTIAVATFITTLMVAVAAWYWYFSGRTGVAKRLDNYIGSVGYSLKVKPVVVPNSQKPLSGLRGLIRKLSKPLEGPRWTRLLEHKLIQAGLPLKSSEFLVIWIGSSLLGALLLFLLSGGKGGLATAGFSFGALIPLLVLRIKIQRRLKQFNAQLGDALILIANSLRTGYSFLQAVEMVSKEMPPPISTEFGKLLKEMNLGVTAEDAMNNMAKRMNSDDLDLVVTAVVIQRQIGGNLAEILDNIATTIRERVKIKGEIKTLTAQGRMSGIIICGLPFCVGILIYMINPDYMRILFTHPAGKIMLMIAVTSQVIGIIVIRKIVDIRV